MDLYSRKQRWKLVLAMTALAIVGASLWYSSRMVGRVRTEERTKVNLWAEAVRNRTRAMRIRQRGSNEVLLTVTLSGGVTALKPGDDEQALIARADAALYRAKRSGRDRVTVE